MTAEQTTISLRGSTRGELTEFLEREKKDCAFSNKVISGLIGKLWNYKEEGIEFSPTIIYTDSISQLSKGLPGYSSIRIGCCDPNEESAKTILKDCAPLTGESSFIYIERNETEKAIHYGIFSFFRAPTAMSIEEAVVLDSSHFAVLIKKSSPTMIKILGSRSNSVSIIMSTTRETDNSDSEIQKFINDIASEIEGENNDFIKYFRKVLNRELTVCHGTILLCANGPTHPNLKCIADRVSLEDGLDVYSLFEDFRRDGTAESLLALQRAEELFRGFLSCDGMIVFSNSGKIISYRVFFKPDGETTGEKVVGGARRRAFSGICAIKSSEIKSALFRSQDGTTEYKEIAHVTE